MNRTLKTLILIILLCMLVSTSVFADSVGGYEFNIKTPDNTEDATTVAGSILKMAQWVSIVAAVIIITIVGLKYMFGSLEEKAQYKKSMIPLVVGVSIVALATTITRIIFTAF